MKEGHRKLEPGYAVGGEPGMRSIVYTIALVLVFSVLVRTVWLRSSVVTEGYAIRRLRERLAEERNINEALKARVARKATLDALIETAGRLDIQLGREVSRIVRVSPTGSSARR